MKHFFNLHSSYSYVNETSTTSQIRQKGVECAQSHGRKLRVAAERAVCRYYGVPNLYDCKSDKILDAGNHHYENGVPFRVIDLRDNRFLIQDVKTKREIFCVHRFNVDRQGVEQQALSDACSVTVVTMFISQDYTTFDNAE